MKSIWDKLLDPVQLAAIGVVVISILAAIRGDYEAAGTFLGAGAFAYLFLRD